MINRLGNAVYWIALVIAALSIFFTQPVVDSLLGIERVSGYSEDSELLFLFSFFSLCFFALAGWSIRFLLTGYKGFGLFATSDDQTASGMVSYLFGLPRRIVFLAGWGSFRLAMLMIAVAAILFLVMSFSSQTANLEVLLVPLFLSASLILLSGAIWLISYVVTGKRVIEK